MIILSFVVDPLVILVVPFCFVAVMPIVGFTLSNVHVNVLLSRLLFPPASVYDPADTLIEQLP
jgi:hypothetical protein